MAPRPDDISAPETLFGFFYDKVHAARRNQGARLTDETEIYLVGLLVGFLRSQDLFRPDGTRKDEVPLAIRLRQAQLAGSHEGARELKHVGDYSLYMSGFFAESLKRSLVDLDYYVALGETAYGSLARAFAGRTGDRGGIFAELARRFGACVGVLAEVSESTRGTTNRDVLALYEAWLDTQNDHTRRRLQELGVLPSPAARRKGTPEPLH